MDNRLKVVIAAAGMGSRMNSGINKQYMLIKGRPVLAYSLDLFDSFHAVESIVIVAKESELGYCQEEIVNRYGYKKVAAVIAGGRERQDSVRAGLRFFDDSHGWVAVHDGARPCISAALLQELLEAAKQWGAAVPGIAARDTLKIVDEKGFVLETLDRSRIVAVQTPQIFRLEKILAAYEKAYAQDLWGTDDASLFERYGGRVKIVAGDNRNLKITAPEDLKAAESFL